FPRRGLRRAERARAPFRPNGVEYEVVSNCTAALVAELVAVASLKNHYMPDSPSTAKLVIPPEIAEMLGPPPALLPQDVQLHERLLQAFAQEVQPHGILDWLHVRHLADAELARQRYTRLTAKLIARPRQHQYDLALDTLENELAQRVEEAKQVGEQRLR